MDQHQSRREFLGGLAAVGAGAAVAARARGGRGPLTGGVARAAQTAPDTGSGPYALPPLPYGFDALEPHIDARTMEIHHDRHHATYVKNLNAAVEGLPDLQPMSPEELIANLARVPEDKRAAVRNNAGGHANHSLFWEIMGPNGGAPTGALAAAIQEAFGSVAALREAINKAGLGRFGSGWAWLIVGADGALAVTSTPNQDSPLMAGLVDLPGTPVLGVDVWEHAYYLAYQNKRADYLAAWWNTVNWEAVGRRYERARDGQL
jgi:Fe-Mn family superoxide dismutase